MERGRGGGKLGRDRQIEIERKRRAGKEGGREMDADEYHPT